MIYYPGDILLHMEGREFPSMNSELVTLSMVSGTNAGMRLIKDRESSDNPI